MIEKWVFLNGTFCQEKDAFIPVTDRGFLFGDGLFTTIRVRNGTCEFYERHLHRLQQQAEVLHFNWEPLNFKWIAELIARNQAQTGMWRLKIIVTVAEKEGERKTGNVFAAMETAQDFAFNPCTLCVFPHPIDTSLAHIKSLSYLDHLYVRDYAQRKGYTDAITTTAQGFLLETGCANIFWFHQGKYWMPDTRLPYLKGIFLQSLLSHLSLPAEPVYATIDQIPSGASVYICNALTHIRPVLAIDQMHFCRNARSEDLLKIATVRALQGNS